ncbi:Hypothetical protein D9617_15g042830 [Elsinoe fawcettii]|nr:Hypothetical protein D9617_15g042830 [Elsinoe fawcettii]
MSGLARSVLLKAKGSIDHIRGMPEDGEQGGIDVPTRSFSSAQTRPYGVLEAGEAPQLRRSASLSLRRALTTTTKSKRSSMFANMMAKKSLTKLAGPEEILENTSETGSSHTSPARASLRSLHVLSMTRSNDSSPRSSGKVHTPDGQSRDHDSIATTGSIPIPIPHVGPPPTIDFDIESGRLSPTPLFEVEFDSGTPEKNEACPTHESIDGPDISTVVVDTETRNTMIIAKRRSKRQAIKNELERIKDEHIHIPRRSSTDHWRMRRVSRNRPSKLPDAVAASEIIPDIPSPMPGTNLPLDDPFDTHDSAARVANVSGHSHDTAVLPAAHDGSADLAASPLVRHSSGPSSRTISDTQKTLCSMDEVIGDAPDETTHSRRLSGREHFDQMTPQALRVEIEAGRKALQFLESRMVGIEAKLLSAGPYVTPLPAPPPLTVRGPASESPSTPFDTAGICYGSPAVSSAISQAQHVSVGSSGVRSSSAGTSVVFSDTCQSPLEVQDLFYPSDDESAVSSAKRHLRQMQVLAANRSPDHDSSRAISMTPSGAKATRHISPNIVPSPHSLASSISAPNMGSPIAFYGKRADREQRY